jgi:putative hydrolase of the HAD superfamily
VIEAVLFDWGGTITRFHSIDFLEPWLVAAAVLAPDNRDEVAKALLAAEEEVWARTQTTMLSARIDDVLAAASEAVGLPVERTVRELAKAAYFDHWSPTTAARDDARSTLVTIRGWGLGTGLLSNTHWPREQHERWLDRDGLLDLLDVRVYTSDLEHVKPHPDAFGAVLDQLGVQPARAVFVGDRLWDDVAGASRLGMRTVWMRNTEVPFHDVEPNAVIDELADLVPVLEAWR